MRPWFFCVTLIFVIAAFFTYDPATGYACDCAVPDSVEEELERNDAVFSGSVLDIYNPNEDGVSQSSADPIYVLFEVDLSWKGVEDTQTIVKTELDSASCGFPFEVGEDYLVYASEDSEFLKTHICGRTAQLSEAEEDIAILGEGNNELESVEFDLQEQVGEGANDIIVSVFTFFVYSLFILAFSSIAYFLIVNVIRKRRQ